jgi:gas vesicle protein
MKKLLGVVAAAAAGYVAGVLFAPKSGEETRKDLKAKKDELELKATAKKEQAKEVLDESTQRVKKGAADISDEAADFSKTLGTQAKRSLGRAADTATKTGKDVGESVNKLR